MNDIRGYRLQGDIHQFHGREGCFVRTRGYKFKPKYKPFFERSDWATDYFMKHWLIRVNQNRFFT